MFRLLPQIFWFELLFCALLPGLPGVPSQSVASLEGAEWNCLSSRVDFLYCIVKFGTSTSIQRVPSVALAKERRANVQTSLIKSSLLGLIISWQRVTSSMYESVFSYLLFTALQLSSHSRAVVLSYFTRYAHAGTPGRAARVLIAAPPPLLYR